MRNLRRITINSYSPIRQMNDYTSSRGNSSEGAITFQSQNNHHCHEVHLPQTIGGETDQFAAHNTDPNGTLSLLFHSSEFLFFSPAGCTPPQILEQSHMQSLTSPLTAATLCKPHFSLGAQQHPLNCTPISAMAPTVHPPCSQGQ